MSEYTKTTWNSGAAPGISAANLNNLETQYDCAKDDLDDHVGEADPHDQYQLKSLLTTRGDIIYRGASAWARLAKGTAGQVLIQGADDPAWGALNPDNLLNNAYSAGDYLFYSNSSISWKRFQTDYIKVRELIVPHGGTIRIKFDLYTDDAGVTAYGRIYRNGVAVGTERSTTSTSAVTFSEDLSGWSRGDTLELWIKQGTNNSEYIRGGNVRLYSGNVLDDVYLVV